MSHAINLKPGSVQETMLIPLWGRSTFSRLYPEIINDQEAEKIINDLDYDFSNYEKAMGEYGGIAYLVRAKHFDDAIRDYIQRFPQATIVNLGCGLDTTFPRVDNGQIRWYNIDLPDAINFRQSLIPDADRSICLQRSAVDLQWLGEVMFTPSKGIFIFAGGLFMYLKQQHIRNLFISIAEQFPGGELHFDAMSWMGLSFMNAKLKRSGIPKFDFFVNNSQKLFAKWSTKLEVIYDVSFWDGTKRNSHWKIGTKIMMDLCDLMNNGKFIGLKILT